MKNLFLSLILVFVSIITNAQWDTTNVGVFDAQYTAFAKHPTSKEIYLAYDDVSIQGELYVKYFDGFNWNALGSQLTTGGISGLDLKVAPNGDAYAVYVEGDAVILKMYNGTSWVQVGTDVFDGAGYSPNSVKLAFNNVGNKIYVAFRWNEFGDDKIYVMEYNGSSWVGVSGTGVVASSSIGLGDLNMQNDPVSDRVSITYAENTDLYVYEYNGTSWVAAGPSVTSSSPSFIDYIIDGNGDKYAAYRSVGSDNYTHVSKFVAGSWIEIGGTEVDTVSSRYNSLMVDNNGEIYIAFEDADSYGSDTRSRVFHFDGSDWVDMTGGNGVEFHPGFSNSKQRLLGGNFGEILLLSHKIIEGEEPNVYRLCQEPIITAAPTNVLCNGGNDGAINASATGGMTPYSYNWSNTATTQNIAGLSAGSYIVTVMDNNGCSESTTAIVNEPTALNVGTGTTHVTCNGLTDGAVNATATGGTSPYGYLWNALANNQATGQATGLAAGTYTLSITDANNCLLEHTATVGEPAPLSINIAANDVLCNGNSSGSTNTNVFGGTSQYSYVWSNGVTAVDLSSEPAGSYSLTVTDSNGCVAIESTTIEEPSPFIPNQIIKNETCVSNDGEVSLTPTGGVSPYNYEWNGGSTDSLITGLASGSYSVTINDFNECSFVENFSVGLTLPPTVSLFGADLTCHQSADGSVSSLVTAGATPYTYLWSNSATTNSITGLGANTYTLTVTDANTCEVVVSEVVNEPAALSASFVLNTSVTCAGGSDGEAEFSLTGGTPGYTFMWNNGVTSQTNSGLTLGVYSSTITDANGCSVSVSGAVPGPLAINISDSQISPLCNGDATGAIEIDVTGGATPYFFNWSNGSATEDLLNVMAGAYSLTVTDNKGCTELSLNHVITEPNSIQGSFNLVEIDCFGAATGEVTRIANGGTSPYTYAWSNGVNGPTITGLVSGLYTVTTTDANACTADIGINLSEPNQLVTSFSSYDALCVGSSTGAISAQTTGGTTPYMYAWSNGQSTDSIANVQSGDYYITITDDNGCANDSMIYVDEPTPISVSVTASNLLCYGANNALASISADGGTTPYSYLWSNGNTTTLTTGLVEGAYTVSLTDNNGCTEDSTVVVTAPDQLEINAIATNELCDLSNGEIQTSVVGGVTPYSYAWSNGVTTASITGVLAGAYGVTVLDNNSCSIDSSLTLTNTPGTTTSLGNQTDVTCNGFADGSLEVNTAGGVTPYVYSWSGNGSTSNVAMGLTAGAYGVTSTDANGCVSEITLTVQEPASIGISLSSNSPVCRNAETGDISSTILGGTIPYSYLWNNTEITTSITGLGDGIYSLQITDANGCLGSESTTLTDGYQVLGTANTTASTCGSANGGAIVTGINGLAPYTYNWSNGETTNQISSVQSGMYYVTITDANSCEKVKLVGIGDDDGATISLNNMTPANCGGNDGKIRVNVVGGTNPLTYQWDDGNTHKNNLNAFAGENNLLVVDANGCSSLFTVTVSSLGTNPPIVSGNVTSLANGFTITSGVVKMYTHNPYFAQMNNVITAPIDANGDYIVDEVLPVGDYWIMAVADTSVFAGTIPTYLGITHNWDSATVVTLGCDQVVDTADIKVISLPSLNGTSTLEGFVLWDTTNVRAGDPIPGIGISLEQRPGGIIAHTETDAQGEYQFEGVPVMTDSSYVIHVDMAGMAMEETYTIAVTSDTVASNLNFYVGDSTIYIDQVTGVEVVLTELNAELSIFPNPFTAFTTLTYAIEQKSEVGITVVNSVGSVIYKQSAQTKPAGNYVVELNSNELNLTQGIYFVEITVNGNSKVLKLVNQ